MREEHRRNRANPIPVSRQDSILIRHAPAHPINSSEPRLAKTQSCYPSGHLSPGKKELLARCRSSLHVKADEDYKDKVEDENHDIDGRQRRQLARAKRQGEECGRWHQHQTL